MDKPIRVLFISDADEKYGAPRAMMELIFELRSKHHVEPVVFVCSNGRLMNIFEDRGIECYVSYHRSSMINKGKKNIQSLFKDKLRFIRYVICKYISVELARKYIDFKNIDIIHSNSNRVDFGLILSKKYNIPHVMHLREQSEGCKFHQKGTFRLFNEKWNTCIAISNTVKDGWVKRGLSQGLVRVIYDGLDIKDIIPHDYKEERRDNIFKIVCVGSLYENKGQQIILKSIGMLPQELQKNIYFDMYGEGENEATLHRLIKDLNLKNVRLYGYTERIHEILGNYDCGITASKMEGFGRTTTEYLAAKLCVIAAKSGATVEIIDDRKNGLLFNRNNPSELSEKIKELYENHSLRKQLAINGYEMVQKLFTDEINAREVSLLYEECLICNSGELK